MLQRWTLWDSVDILAGCLFFLSSSCIPHLFMISGLIMSILPSMALTPCLKLWKDSLDESRDSLLIGSQMILHHALISELSNIIDDLQDYILYFSSKFLILCSNSPNLVKELQASYDRFEHLSVCWGAIISQLVLARKIVERNFWPHFFQPSINKLPALQRCKQP